MHILRKCSLGLWARSSTAGRSAERDVPDWWDEDGAGEDNPESRESAHQLSPGVGVASRWICTFRNFTIPATFSAIRHA